MICPSCGESWGVDGDADLEEEVATCDDCAATSDSDDLAQIESDRGS